MSSPTPRLLKLGAALVAFSAFGSAGTIGAATLGLAPAALAQDAQQQPPSAADRERGRKAMAEALMSVNPSDAQKAKIRELRTAMIKSNEGVTDRSVRREHYKKFMADIDSVLTPGQVKAFHAKLDAMRKQYRAEHPDAQAGH